MRPAAKDANNFVPALVTTVELTSSQWHDELVDGFRRSASTRALVLVRLCGDPVGVAEVARAEVSRDPNVLERAVLPELRSAETRHGHRADDPSAACSWQAADAALRQRPEKISVVVCTHGEALHLTHTLDGLCNLTHPAFEVVLVDNAPTGMSNRQLASSYADRLDIRYVVAPQVGLSRARNAGVKASAHDVIAFTDDDVIVDPDWLWGIQAGFARAPHVGAVSGPVLPAEMQSLAQELFEVQGGHSKARGFAAAVFGKGADAQSPLFPLPPFAVGANMALRREALEDIGGFDPALGAGTPSRAGEDTAAISELLLKGWRCAYEPRAIARHFHRRTISELMAQRRSYGIGLGAFYASMLTQDPRRLWPLAKVGLPAAWAMLRSQPLGTISDGARSSAVQPRAILMGPAAYVRGRRLAARPGISGSS